MNLYICIDDTDNLESKGTGTIAEELRELIAVRFGGKTSFVSRHQLLIHKDIEYTSHNSSMCFECEIEDNRYEELKKACCAHLKQESAEGSDPGICIADKSVLKADLLVSYGKDCKRKIMSKDIAYDTAKKAGVFLTELGGTGIGIIGALAGIGLRIWGNDGTPKGKVKEFDTEEIYTVERLCQSKFIDVVMDENYEIVPSDAKVFMNNKAKPVLYEGKPTLAVILKKDGIYHLIDKDTAKNFGAQIIFKEGCPDFVPDVEEEQISDDSSCHNCRYRRWLENRMVMCSKNNLD